MDCVVGSKPIRTRDWASEPLSGILQDFVVAAGGRDGARHRLPCPAIDQVKGGTMAGPCYRTSASISL